LPSASGKNDSRPLFFLVIHPINTGPFFAKPLVNTVFFKTGTAFAKRISEITPSGASKRKSRKVKVKREHGLLIGQLGKADA